MSADIASAISARTDVLRQYRGTDAYAHMVALLTGLEQHYLQELIDISPAELQFKQGAVRQVRALRMAIEQEHRSPLV